MSFFLVDLDGNGYWDEMEVKALFKKELDKMYDPNAPEDDINERYEEMERMREHVFKESDINRDNLIRFVLGSKGLVHFRVIFLVLQLVLVW